MPSPSSCVRCARLAPLVTPSGLCSTCAAAEDTAALTPRPDPPSQPEPATASFLVPDEPSTAPALAADHPLPPAPPGYDLLSRLGGGGMGEVYLAREQLADRPVAMKFLRAPGDPAALERFVIELRALAKLDHPGIVRVYASDFLRADPYFTMEFVPGGSLAKADGLRPVADAVKLVRTIAVAVAAAHAADVIHRDLKPSNILLGLDGTPKIADFGLAKRLGADDPPTATSGALGTPGYMPPEQVSRKNGEIGAWSDVYGLGATLYHTLVGRAPFVGDSVADTITKVLADPPERVRARRPEVPLALEAVVMKCLEKDPKDRYQTVHELLDDLDRYEAGRRPVAPLLTPWRRFVRWAKRNRRGALTTSGAVLLAGLMLWIGVKSASVPGSSPRTDPPEVPAPHPLAEIDKELDAGGEVELIGPGGKPRYHRWAVGEGALVPAETNDRTFTVQSNGIVLLELLPDARHDRYRVTAELRHLRGGLAPGDGCGAYVGFDSARTDRGAVFSAVFAEFREARPPDDPGGDHARLKCGVLLHPPGRPVHLRFQTDYGARAFVPQPGAVRPVRTISFDVSPGGAELFWGPGDAPERAGRVGLPDLAREGVRAAREAQTAPRAWHSRRPVGLWVSNCAIAIHSVRVRPNPPPRPDRNQ